jgi:hypothetical protein
MARDRIKVEDENDKIALSCTYDDYRVCACCSDDAEEIEKCKYRWDAGPDDRQEIDVRLSHVNVMDQLVHDFASNNLCCIGSVPSQL